MVQLMFLSGGRAGAKACDLAELYSRSLCRRGF